MKIKGIDPLWLAEFRGFFFGEGYIGIASWGENPQGYKRLMPRLQITIRDDDSEVLEDIHKKLGGVLYKAAGRSDTNSNPVIVWRVTKKNEVARILNVLDDGILPSKKRFEIAILREFLTTVPKPGGKPTAEQYKLREKLHQQIKELHAY